MGLFSSGKSCPICGGETPRFFSTKVEGLPLCKECAGKISMENSLMGSLTINGLWDHLDYRTANAQTFEEFMDTECYSMGSTKLHIDANKQMFYVYNGNAVNPDLFKFEELKSFYLEEDGKTIAQGNPSGCSYLDSSIYSYRMPPRKYKEVPISGSSAAKTTSAAPMPKDNMLSHGVNGRANRPGAGHQAMGAGRPGAARPGTIPPRPGIGQPAPGMKLEEETPDEPIDKLSLRLVLDNPYWKNKTIDISLPHLFKYDDLPQWIKDYEILVESAMDVCAALGRLMGVMSPEEKANAVKEKADAIAAIQNAEAAAKEAKAVDMAAAVAMIKQWKELLDMGAITQEEFDAKKKEILG